MKKLFLLTLTLTLLCTWTVMATQTVPTVSSPALKSAVKDKAADTPRTLKDEASAQRSYAPETPASFGYRSFDKPKPGDVVLTEQFCDPSSIFGQHPWTPTEGWTFTTSDLQLGPYLVLDDFNVGGEICDIHWWGLSLFFNAGWFACNDPAEQFTIVFYNDVGGAPDINNPVYTYTPIVPTQTNTGENFAGLANETRYDVVLPSCAIMPVGGWISIQSIGLGGDVGNCAFLWAGSPDGNNNSIQYQSGAPVQLYLNQAFCLTGVYEPQYGACCDDVSGICTDNVEMQSCPPPLRWVLNTLCANIDPLCGQTGCPDATITVEILTDPYPSETTWDVRDSGGNIVGSGGPYGIPNNLYSTDVCVAAGCYTFTIYDAYGDGIYQPGYYRVYYNGVVECENLDFAGSSESCQVGVGCEQPTPGCPIVQQDNALNGIFADPDCDLCGGGGQWVADQVVFTEANVPLYGITFWGGYYPGNVSMDPDHFTFMFHADDGAGQPGAVLYTIADVAAATKAQTGDILFGTNEYVYTFDLTPYSIVLGPGVFHIQIYNNTATSPAPADDWYWETGNMDAFNGVLGQNWGTTGDTGPWNYDPTFDMSWILDCGTGTPAFGACCDDLTGVCTDNVNSADCLPPLRFAENTLCANIDPPCVPPIFEGCEYFDGGLGGFANYNVSGVGWVYNGAVGNPPGAAFHDDNTGWNDSWLISIGNFVVPAGSALNFDQYTAYCSGYYILHELMISTNYVDGNDPSTATWTQLYEGSACENDYAWGSHSLDVSAYYGQGVHIAFHYTGDYATEWTVDNVCIAAPPTGACCVGLDCVATNTQAECDALAGSWHAGEDCDAGYVCPAEALNCDNAVYSNGFPPAYNVFASQCATDYPFQFAAADDFVLPGADPVEVGSVVMWMGHWATSPLSTPATWEGATVTIYYDAGGVPSGNPIDGDPGCAVTGTYAFNQNYIPGDYSYTEEMADVWRVSFPITGLTLDAGTTYWLVVEPIMQFGVGGQSGPIPTDIVTGSLPLLYGPLLGYPTWGNPGWATDLSFCINPPTETSVCGPYVVGDYNGNGTFNVADIIWGYGKLKGQPNPPGLLCECPAGSGNIWAVAGDVNNNCAFNVADVIWGYGKLKGQPNTLVPCASCPPGAPSPRGGDKPLVVPDLKSKVKLSTGYGALQ